MRARFHTIKARGGFTLVELAVVLGIISLIAGVGMTMAQGALKTADRIATQEKLNTIKLALDSFGKTYGYLPCPAARDLTPGSSKFGAEGRFNGSTLWTAGTQCATSTTTPALTGVVSATNVAIGTVPVRTLGLPDSYAGDAWGNKLTYAVSIGISADATRYSYRGGSLSVSDRSTSSTYNVPMQQNSAAISGAWGVSGTNTTVTLGSTGNLYNGEQLVIKGSTSHDGSYVVLSVAGSVATLQTSSPLTDSGGTGYWLGAGGDAAYVVVSHGPDGVGAYPVDQTTPPVACNYVASTSNLDTQNCNDDASFIDTVFNDGSTAATHFDDFVVWGSDAGYRVPVNPSLYYNTLSGCPTGVCEAWCAICATNYPNADSTNVPPTTIKTNGTTNSGVLCKKVVTTNSTTCSATCFWGGTNANGKGVSDGYQPCP